MPGGSVAISTSTKTVGSARGSASRSQPTKRSNETMTMPAILVTAIPTFVG